MTKNLDERWPENVPRDYNELARGEWGKYITKTVARLNKVGRNAEDLQQYIWEKILSSRLLEKYVERMYRDVAPVETEFFLTGDQVCAYLAIRWGQWLTQQWAFHNKGRPGAKWMPAPVTGTPTSRKATYNFRDIVRVASNGTFKKHGEIGTLPEGMVIPEDFFETGKVKSIDANFMGYLKNAIHNHYCNFVRTKERREKERPYDTFSTFTQRTQKMAEPPNYEDQIPADNGCENKAEISAELHIRIERIRQHAGAQAIDILGYLDDGYTMPEAIRKLKVTPKEKRNLERLLLTGTG